MQDNLNPSTPPEPSKIPPPEDSQSDSPEAEPQLDTSSLQIETEEPTQAQTPMEQSAAESSVTQGPSKPSKKKWLVGGIIAGAMVLLGGGGAAAYTLWFQNPDKVVGDALVNILQAKSGTITGTVAAENKDYRLSVLLDTKVSQEISGGSAMIQFKMKTGEFANKDFSIKAESVVAKAGDIYVKVSDFEKLLDTYIDKYIAQLGETYKKYGLAMSNKDLETQRQKMKGQLQPIVDAIDGQWIKIGANDLKDLDDDTAEAKKCFTDAFDKFREDKSVSSEIANAYAENRFITIKEELGGKDGSLGYLLDFDKDAAKKFGDKVKDTKFGKMLQKCDEGEADGKDDLKRESDENDSSLENTRVELWVDRWSHKMTRVTFSGAATGEDAADIDLDLNTTFDGPVKVDVPSDAKSVQDIKDELTKLGSGGSRTPVSLDL